MTQEKKQLLTVPQFAEELSISPKTAYLWIYSRKVASTRIGRGVRIPRAEIDRLVESGMTPAQVA